MKKAIFKHGLKNDGRQYPFLIDEKVEGHLKYNKHAKTWVLKIYRAVWKLPMMQGRLPGTVTQNVRGCADLREAKRHIKEFFECEIEVKGMKKQLFGNELQPGDLFTTDEIADFEPNCTLLICLNSEGEQFAIMATAWASLFNGIEKFDLIELNKKEMKVMTWVTCTNGFPDEWFDQLRLFKLQNCSQDQK
jgi:hypothetical protein